MILPWRLVKRLSSSRSLGTVPVSFLFRGEELANYTKDKRMRIKLCKLFRVMPIYITAQK
jgi:hypothetical protein